MSITLFIIAVTVIISLYAFNNPPLLENLLYYPYRIWRYKEWHRLVSCGFIHADAAHLFFNMFTLYFFGNYVESAFGIVFEGMGKTVFVGMYFLAVAFADTYNLFRNKDNYSYRSLGASGGVAAIIFSYILLNPFGKLYMFFIPIGIPAFIFGPLYLFYSAYMAKRGMDNIGHIAHFTGSVIGFFVPVIIEPALLTRFVNLLTSAI